MGLSARAHRARASRAEKPPASTAGHGVSVSIPAFAPTDHPTLFRSSTHGFVDYSEDVSSKDIYAAAKEGYDSVELLKRYTTVTMGQAQGKLETMNAVAVLAAATGRSIGDPGQPCGAHPTRRSASAPSPAGSSSRSVIILLDSITRLARAATPSSHPPARSCRAAWSSKSPSRSRKRFFGAARNIEGAGSLTIIGTALVDTGSRDGRDHLRGIQGNGQHGAAPRPRLVERRIFPAINIDRSGTRKEELLIEKSSLHRTWILRKVLHPMNVVDSMEFLLDKLSETKSNQDFLDSMSK